MAKTKIEKHLIDVCKAYTLTTAEAAMLMNLIHLSRTAEDAGNGFFYCGTEDMEKSRVFGVSQPSQAPRIRSLESRRLIETSRRGMRRVVRFNDDHVVQTLGLSDRPAAQTA